MLECPNDCLCQPHGVEHIALLVHSLPVLLCHLWRVESGLQCPWLWPLSISVIDHGDTDSDLLVTILIQNMKNTPMALVEADSNLIFEAEGEADSSAVVGCLELSDILSKSNKIKVYE